MSDMWDNCFFLFWLYLDSHSFKPLININPLIHLTKTMIFLWVIWKAYHQSLLFWKDLIKVLFLMMIFLKILSTGRNASAPALNGIPYKVYKKCSKTNNFFSKHFKLILKDVKFPFNGEVLRRYTILKLAVPLRTNSQTFVQ